MAKLSKDVKKALMYAVVGAILFALLSPGMLLTLPPACDGKVLFSLKEAKDGCASSYEAVAVHSLVFAIVAFGVQLVRNKYKSKK